MEPSGQMLAIDDRKRPRSRSGRRSGEASWSQADLLQRLQEAHGLRRILLSRMDEEYQNYRAATERCLEAVSDYLRLALQPLHLQVEALGAEVASLQRRLDGEVPGALSPALHLWRPARLRPRGSQRIRWGSNPEEIRRTIFDQLAQLEEAGKEINSETIKAEVPSMLRWIYGERALFGGMDGLRAAYRRWRAADDGAPAEAPPSGGDEEGTGGAERLA